jgi:hypothetical protein
MPENNFVTENNMKNIITVLPSLHIDDSDSGEYLPEPIIATPSKVFGFRYNLIICLLWWRDSLSSLHIFYECYRLSNFCSNTVAIF